MGILSRLNMLVKANLNDLVGRVTDPGSTVDILVQQMEEHLGQATSELNECVVMEKRLDQERRKLLEEADQWERRAISAVKMGQDDLARQALQQKFDVQQKVTELSSALENHRMYVSNLKAAHKALTVRVDGLKQRKETLKIHARGGIGASEAFSEFDRMERRIEAEAVEAELGAELDPGAKALSAEQLKMRIEELERGRHADQELEALKARVASDRTEESKGRARESGVDPLEDELKSIREQLRAEGDEQDRLEKMKRKLDE